jgi:hypothetical protein
MALVKSIRRRKKARPGTTTEHANLSRPVKYWICDEEMTILIIYIFQFCQQVDELPCAKCLIQFRQTIECFVAPQFFRSHRYAQIFT